MISDDEGVVRIVWQPRDFEKSTGRLKGSHFSPGELLGLDDKHGRPRYVSVDRMQIVVKASIDFRIEKALSPKERREAARFAEYRSGEIRQLTGDVGDLLFVLEPMPFAAGEDGESSPANPAHAGIRPAATCPAAEDERDLKVNEMRNRLLSAYTFRLYEDLFPTTEAA